MGTNAGGEDERTDTPWRDEATLRRLYVEERQTIATIAETFGCTPKTVNDWLDRHEIETRDAAPGSSNPPPWRDEATLRRLYVEEGLSQPKIANKLGTDSGTISKWMARFEIEVRPLGEAISESLTGDSGHKDRDTLRHLYVERGETTYQIAKRFDIDPSTVWYWIDKHEIETRESCTARVYDDALEARDIYYGPNWADRSDARRAYDDYECVVCSMSNGDHIEVHGHQLHVHHLVKLRRFYDPETGTIDYDRANRLENLITFCRGHHARWEGVPVRPETM